MSVFTSVSQSQLSAWLKFYTLGELIELQGIASGIENTNYFVTTTRGKYVLTLFEKLTKAELPYYLSLMLHLSLHDIPCPKPMPNIDNKLLGELNGKPASIVTCLPGKSLAYPTTAQCAEVGAILGKIHLSGQSYTRTMKNPRGLAWCKAKTHDITPYILVDEQRLLTEELHFQSNFQSKPLPCGVIHADLFRDNILFEHNKVGGVIDFYFACNDFLLYDLAIVVNDWCITDNKTLDKACAHSLISEYHRIRPLTAEERPAWPVMLRAGALRFWVSRLYDYYLPRPGEITYAKDPTHFREILTNHLVNHASLLDIWV